MIATVAHASKIKSVSQYLKDVPSQNARTRVRKDLTRRLKEVGLWVGHHPLSSLNAAKREVLHDAIFTVEDDLESRGGGRPDHPVVTALRQARNRVMDDLGWNERQPFRQ